MIRITFGFLAAVVGLLEVTDASAQQRGLELCNRGVLDLKFAKVTNARGKVFRNAFGPLNAGDCIIASQVAPVAFAFFHEAADGMLYNLDLTPQLGTAFETASRSQKIASFCIHPTNRTAESLSLGSAQSRWLGGTCSGEEIRATASFTILKLKDQSLTKVAVSPRSLAAMDRKEAVLDNRARLQDMAEAADAAREAGDPASLLFPDRIGQEQMLNGQKVVIEAGIFAPQGALPPGEIVMSGGSEITMAELIRLHGRLIQVDAKAAEAKGSFPFVYPLIIALDDGRRALMHLDTDGNQYFTAILGFGQITNDNLEVVQTEFFENMRTSSYFTSQNMESYLNSQLPGWTAPQIQSYLDSN